MLISLVDISPGEAITVSYTKDGYHDSSQACLCSTCRPDNPPLPTKRREPEVLSPKPGKKKRRGGRMARIRRENRELYTSGGSKEAGIASGSHEGTDDSGI